MVILIQKTVLLVFLAAAAFIDYRRHSLPWILIAAGAVCGITLQIIIRGESLLSIIGGCGTGLVLLLLFFLSHGRIGPGDGLSLAVSGIFLGFTANLFLLLFSSIFSGLTALFLIVVKKYKKDHNIPFMPFVLGGYVCLLLFSV